MTTQSTNSCRQRRLYQNNGLARENPGPRVGHAGSGSYAHPGAWRHYRSATVAIPLPRFKGSPGHLQQLGRGLLPQWIRSGDLRWQTASTTATPDSPRPANIDLCTGCRPAPVRRGQRGRPYANHIAAPRWSTANASAQDARHSGEPESRNTPAASTTYPDRRPRPASSSAALGAGLRRYDGLERMCFIRRPCRPTVDHQHRHREPIQPSFRRGRNQKPRPPQHRPPRQASRVRSPISAQPRAGLRRYDESSEVALFRGLPAAAPHCEATHPASTCSVSSSASSPRKPPLWCATGERKDRLGHLWAAVVALFDDAPTVHHPPGDPIAAMV